MPKSIINYSNTIIYKIVCKDISISDCYVGSTTNFIKRKYSHKHNCYNDNTKEYKRYLYEFIRNNGNWDNWDMIQIEIYNASDSNDAHKRERYYVEELKATLNSNTPSRTKTEYYYENKKTYLEKVKEYSNANKEKLKEKNKKYREINEEKLKEKSKKYREINREDIKERRSEKIKCICGCTVRKNDLIRHQRSKKHENLMKSL